MSGNRFARLNAKATQQATQQSPEPAVTQEKEQTDTQTNKPTDTQVIEPTDTQTNKQPVARVFDPTFTNLPGGTGVHLDIEDLRPLLIQTGKETRSFSLHGAEKVALDRATFSLKMHGLKCDANKIARVVLTHGLAELEEKGKDSFLYQMLDNLSN